LLRRTILLYYRHLVTNQIYAYETEAIRTSFGSDQLVPISLDEVDAYINPPKSINELKLQQWETIKAARTQAEYGGFTWDGSTFDSDAISQARLTGAVQLAQLNPALALDWTLASNTVRTLSAADLTAVGVALGVHVSTQFTKGQTLRAQIDAATTKEAVEAIVW